MPDEPAQTPEVALSTAKPGRIKRALWCRWFHRWHMPRYPAPAVSGRDPAGSSSFTLSAGPHRSCCDACRDFDYGRAHRRWLAS
jgi:hypothetical protein